MKSKIFLLLPFAIILAVLAYFAYPIVKNRYFNNVSENKPVEQFSSGNPEISSNNQADESVDSPESSIPTEETVAVSESDCADECSGYTSTNDKASCLEECRISASKDVSADCASLSGTEKDSCWKEKAIKENKFEDCDNIVSVSVKKSCKDRLTENVLEAQTPE